MKSKSKIIRFSDVELDNLKHLAKCTGENESETIRKLIPPKDIIDALVEYHLTAGAPQKSPFMTWWACLELAMRSHMDQAAPNPMHPLQVTRQTPEGLSRVFAAFCKAQRGEQGYSFETVMTDGEKYTLVNDGKHCRGEDQRTEDDWLTPALRDILREGNQVESQGEAELKAGRGKKKADKIDE